MQPVLECGLDPATAHYRNRCLGVETNNDRILYGLLMPKVFDMATRGPIEPVSATILAWHTLQICTGRQFIRLFCQLERRNNAILLEHYQLLVDERARRGHRDGPRRAQGTRSTRRKRKRPIGQRS